MVELPFQQPQTLNQRQNKALALAAVFQATQLTHMTAISGRQSIGESGNFYFEQLIKASLNIRPSENQSSQTLDFFHQLSDISLGLKTLESSITQPFTPTPKSKIPKLSSAKLPMSYAMSLLTLEKKVYSNPKFVEIIENAQQKILKQLSFFDQDYAHPSIVANLAQTYVDTAGQINPRILVRGNAEAFKDPAHTNRIRACLFTGLQMAHLWRQLGGSSWNMIFSKRKLLRDIQDLARLQFQIV
ncbi:MULTISPECIES: high frequency lysogenization protein HflD [unclassified Acinetobacter]|uniref:high frequency lysogenization protein HflD n=1 Tax=unclassified Acinetobacter TaxID=196816 RepID=UPI002574D682|nr:MULTISPECIES: high frequency lysogenization protein HflD [unclassified Acinetobacter]MDM1763057.1 high frequency lysogenization protein HflD [Acinetobacter sp. 226-1]MDM1766536.1 high frequency lysogenization protein HflD [Acinetobacter sp. 226-4]